MKKSISYFIVTLLVIATIGFGYHGYEYCLTQANLYHLYILVGGIVLISFFTIISFIVETIRRRNSGGYSIISLSILTALVIGVLVFQGIIEVPTKETVPNFYNKELAVVNDWGKEHNITINSIYENSDTIDKYSIISQDGVGQYLEEVSSLNVVISDGPSYDKKVIVPNMLSWNIDEVIEYINTNYLNNVTIDFANSQEELYTVIEQNNNGKMARNDKLALIFAYNQDALGEQTMIDMSEYDKFNALLWFKQYGLSYKETYEFSDEVARGRIISISKEVGDTINLGETVDIVISKGKEIVVGDLSEMSVEQITAWVIDNNLEVSFSDKYDDTVEAGGIIKTNYDQGDEIEEETLIKVVVSKGQLKMESFSSLAEFKSWAEEYKIDYTLTKQFSDTISSGKVISYSYKEGEVIPNGGSIKVVVSKGKAIVVPSLIGKTKSDIKSLCSSLGLNCSFVYGGYSSTKKDVATGQAIASGSKVASGTTIKVTLSKGPAKSFTVKLQASLLGSSYKSTVNSLTKYFEENYPGVIFKFKAYSGANDASKSSGMISYYSPVKDGTKVTQGKTYYVYIVK